MDVQGLKATGCRLGSPGGISISHLLTLRRCNMGPQPQLFGASTRTLVLNSFAEGHSHHYYAILTREFPHTLRVEADCEMTTQSAADNGNCIKIDLQVDNEKLLLPDFSQIETHSKEIPLYY